MVLNAFLDDRNTATENTGGLGDGFIVVKDEFGGSSRLRNRGRNHHSGGEERGLANEAIRLSSYTNMKSRKQCGCWSRYGFTALKVFEILALWLPENRYYSGFSP